MWASLMEAQSLTDETFTTAVTHLRDQMTVHSFEYKVTGAGTVVIRAYTSISGANWINNGVKANGIGATSGIDGNGQDVVPMRLKPGELIRFTVTATGTAAVTLWFSQK
jgi:hypothetical protein